MFVNSAAIGRSMIETSCVASSETELGRNGEGEKSKSIEGSERVVASTVMRLYLI